MIVITQNEIKIKHQSTVYALKSMPFLGFSYSYLYYEPEADLFRKVVLNFKNEHVYEDLTANEKLIIEKFLLDLDDTVFLADFLDQHEKRPELVRFDTNNDTPATPTHAVNADGFYVGQQVLPKEGLTEVPSFPPKDLYLEPFGINYKWDRDNNTWIVNGTYQERRKYQYLNQITYGDQLDAIISAIDALSKGHALPEKFNQLMAKIESIKLSNPKD
jgi:hypothetical protein